MTHKTVARRLPTWMRRQVGKTFVIAESVEGVDWLFRDIFNFLEIVIRSILFCYIFCDI